ncbi:hypothetical protein KBG31_02145 [Patescibacteria group bacterium]|nr:hypothetical protein [Patescibacteria group bacterium]
MEKISKEEALRMLREATLEILRTPSLWASPSNHSRHLGKVLNEVYASWGGRPETTPNWYFDVEGVKSKVCTELFRYLAQQEGHRGALLAIQMGERVPADLQAWADGWQDIVKPKVLKLFE